MAVARFLTRLIVSLFAAALTLLVLSLLITQAFPTEAERQARAAQAYARAQTAQAWAEQADERAASFTLFLQCILATVAFTAFGLGLGLVRAVHLRSQTLHAHPDTGLYPAVRERGRWQILNEPGAQHFAALPARPTAALARALTTPRAPEPLAVVPPPEAPEMFSPTAIDLIHRPHTILLGRTGSGKSNAAHAIADAIRRRYPAEFVLCEPGGVTWGEQCHASELTEIAETIRWVEAEMRRRQALLVAHDCQHVGRLPTPLPALVLLVEELEDFLDTLRLARQQTAPQTRIALRNIAREGRKAGVCLLLVTQVGRGDVLDTHIRHNAGALYLFQNAAAVGQALRVPPTVRLDRLGVGEAYEYHTQRVVRFPVVSRPSLPLVPRERLTRSADVAPELSPTEAPPALIPAGRRPTPEEAEQMRALYQAGESLTGLCFRFYGYKDGVVFHYVKEAVHGVEML